MPTEVDIANIAIREAGETRISSFTEGTKPANIMLDIYDETLEDLLRYPWNWAQRRLKLAQHSVAPAFGYDYAYPVPSDWVYTVSVHGDEAGVNPIEYKEEYHEGKNAIVTNHADVYMVYTALITDPNRMAADFRMAFAFALARNLAYSLGQSNTRYEALKKEAGLRLNKAKSTDSITSTPGRRPRGSWANARSGWRRSNTSSNA